jgi:hypothetical protein
MQIEEPQESYEGYRNHKVQCNKLCSIRHTAMNWVTSCLIVESESSAPLIHMVQKYPMVSEVM